MIHSEGHMTYVKDIGRGGAAIFSPDRKYRYVLTRGSAKLARPVWIMLNPSTAGAEGNDHTITKCLGFSERWGFGGIFVVNLYAYISTDPRGLLQAKDPVGFMNDAWLRRASEYAKNNGLPVIAGWGNNAPIERIEAIAHLFPEIYCLGVTAHEQPKHPLRLAYETPLIRWA